VTTVVNLTLTLSYKERGHIGLTPALSYKERVHFTLP
jgi:hypothetical protein